MVRHGVRAIAVAEATVCSSKAAQASNLAVSQWLGILISVPRPLLLSFDQGKYAGKELLPTHIAPV